MCITCTQSQTPSIISRSSLRSKAATHLTSNTISRSNLHSKADSQHIDIVNRKPQNTTMSNVRIKVTILLSLLALFFLDSCAARSLLGGGGSSKKKKTNKKKARRKYYKLMGKRHKNRGRKKSYSSSSSDGYGKGKGKGKGYYGKGKGKGKNNAFDHGKICYRYEDLTARQLLVKLTEQAGPNKSFNILLDLIIAAGLDDDIDGNLPFDVTLLAPNDQAFCRTATELGYQKTCEPPNAEDVVEFYVNGLISLVPPGTSFLEALTLILTYHAIEGAYTVEDMRRIGEFETLCGCSIEVEKVKHRGHKITRIIDGGKKYPIIDYRQQNYKVHGGFVHVMKGVLLPEFDDDSGHPEDLDTCEECLKEEYAWVPEVAGGTCVKSCDVIADAACYPASRYGPEDCDEINAPSLSCPSNFPDLIGSNANGANCIFCLKNDSECGVACLGPALCLCDPGDTSCCKDNPCCGPCIDELDPDSDQYKECTVSSCAAQPPSCGKTICP